MILILNLGHSLAESDPIFAILRYHLVVIEYRPIKQELLSCLNLYLLVQGQELSYPVIKYMDYL
jgi:hypothetical protein